MADAEEVLDAPLDPATERLRRRMVRLLAVSIGIMFVGVMAVLAAVVYRATSGPGTEIARGASMPLSISGEIVETSLDGDRLALRLRGNEGREEIVIMELSTGELLSRHPIERR